MDSASLLISAATKITILPGSGLATAVALPLTYDQEYQLYPVKVSGPMVVGGQLLPTYFEYYGFKDSANNPVALDGFQKQPGQLKRVEGRLDATITIRALFPKQSMNMIPSAVCMPFMTIRSTETQPP